MEAGTLPGSMDCYEDMFKEITRKLYGTEDGLSSAAATTTSATNSTSTSSSTNTPPVTTSNNNPSTTTNNNNHHNNNMAEGRNQRYDDPNVSIPPPFVKTEDGGSTLTAFGLAALMQQGFQPAVAAMHSSGYHHNAQGHYPAISPHHLPTTSSNSQIAPPAPPTHHHPIHHQPHLVPAINIPPPPQPTATETPGHVDRWISSDDEMHWTRSKIATYNPAQRMFKCSECDCVGFLSRVAEHWIGTHANLRVYQCPQCPYTSAWARCVRMHIARQHGGGSTEGAEGNEPENASSTTNPEGSNNNENNETYNANPSSTSPIPSSLWKENAVLEEVTKYLQRLKTKAENIPNKPQEFSNSSSSRGGSSSEKRYCCTYCPYATDRRDLFTRHENIHRDEKPFQCYVCRKQFNRADHVKKHFLRMHRDHPYDINKIRRQPPKNASGMSYYQKYTNSSSVTSTSVTTTTASSTNNQPGTSRNPPIHHPQLAPPPAPQFQHGPHHLHAPHHLQPPQHHLLQSPLQTPHYNIPLRTPTPSKFQPQKPNGPSKSHKKKPTMAVAPNSQVKEQKEKRYTCCYCSWSGVDNWCLKRHLNTHIKPFVCALCDYKAARSERLATHVLKVHNKRTCSKCSFLADDQLSLTEHIHEQQQRSARVQ